MVQELSGFHMLSLVSLDTKTKIYFYRCHYLPIGRVDSPPGQFGEGSFDLGAFPGWVARKHEVMVRR
jgi:hypothetical protein